jgi:hypothetical protein
MVTPVKNIIVDLGGVLIKLNYQLLNRKIFVLDCSQIFSAENMRFPLATTKSWVLRDDVAGRKDD